MNMDHDGVIRDWHDWFAWRPVFLPGYGLVWLQKIQRRIVRFDTDGEDAIARRADYRMRGAAA